MKPAAAKFSKPPETPVFQTVIHEPAAAPKAVAPSPKSQKRDNTFSKSRDTREDRGTRQAKASSNPQTLPHGR
jgi:hypothetical protein